MPEQIYSYSVKFVCGTQESTRDCTSVRPGVYSTEINIHNFKNAEAHIQKYVLPIVFAGKPPVREPEYVKPVGQHEITLPPQTATMDDCCSISQLLHNAPLPLMPLTIGFLVIESSQELNVTAVYTVSDLRYGFVSIEVEQVVGKLK